MLAAPSQVSNADVQGHTWLLQGGVLLCTQPISAAHAPSVNSQSRGVPHHITPFPHHPHACLYAHKRLRSHLAQQQAASWTDDMLSEATSIPKSLLQDMPLPIDLLADNKSLPQHHVMRCSMISSPDALTEQSAGHLIRPCLCSRPVIAVQNMYLSMPAIS